MKTTCRLKSAGRGTVPGGEADYILWRMRRAPLFPGLLCLLFVAGCAESTLRTATLRCEYREDPLAIDVSAPRLSWILTSDQRGERQTGYQIQAASDPNKLAGNSPDLWDSGKIASADSIQIAWGGKQLRSDEQCFWRVRVWDKDGRASAWSQAAQWTMGILSPGEWEARWIGNGYSRSSKISLPLPILRKEFSLAVQPHRAVIYLCGLGQFELHINGQRMGNGSAAIFFSRGGRIIARLVCMSRTM
jgi:alpha-L-rhamnosidase